MRNGIWTRPTSYITGKGPSLSPAQKNCNWRSWLPLSGFGGPANGWRNFLAPPKQKNEPLKLYHQPDRRHWGCGPHPAGGGRIAIAVSASDDLFPGSQLYGGSSEGLRQYR